MSFCELNRNFFLEMYKHSTIIETTNINFFCQILFVIRLSTHNHVNHVSSTRSNELSISHGNDHPYVTIIYNNLCH